MPARGSRALEAEVADCRNVSLEQLKGRADGLGQRSGGRTRSGESGDVMRNPMRRMLRAPVEFRSRRGVPRHGCATPSPAGKPQRWALADRATHRDVQPSHPTPSTITPPSREASLRPVCERICVSALRIHSIWATASAQLLVHLADPHSTDPHSHQHKR